MPTYQSLLDFAIRHWILVVALVVIVALLILEETKKSTRGMKKLLPKDVVDLMNHEDALLVDCRGKGAFAGGHILNAENIPGEEIEASVKRLMHKKQRPVVVLADTDPNAITAGIKLRKHGLEKIYYLAGGMQAWKNAGLPVVK